MKPRSRSIVLVVVMLLVAVSTVGTAVWAHQRTMAEQDRLRSDAAAAELAGIRFTVAAAVLRLAGTRLLAAPDDAEQAAARDGWTRERARALRRLDPLLAGPVAPEAQALAERLEDASSTPPDDLAPMLERWSGAVLVATLPLPSTPARAVTDFELALDPFARNLGALPEVTVFWLGAQRSLGVGTRAPEVARWIDAEGFPAPSRPRAPTGVDRRDVAPPPRDAADRAAALADIDALRPFAPALADDLDAAQDLDGTRLGTMIGWTDEVLGEKARTARPLADADALAALVSTGSLVADGVDQAAVRRAAALEQQAESEGDRAGRFALLATGAGLVTVAGLAVLLRRRRQQDRALRTAAGTDPLTGLANRRHLESEAAARFAAPGRHGVVVVDLDDFKPVNDAHGHAAGDEVLRELAGRFRAAVRPGDVVARTGGDEFVVVLLDLVGGAGPGAGSGSAGPVDRLDPVDLVAQTAARIAARADEPVVVGGLALRVSASTGTAVRTGEEDLAATIAVADARLYDAKRDRGSRPVRDDQDLPGSQAAGDDTYV